MIYTPPRAAGLALRLAAIVLLAGLDLALLATARTRFPSMMAFAAACLFLASLPVLAWLGYGVYGLARARYVLSRNALVVEWGGRRELIPLDQVDEVRAGLDAPRASVWLGLALGRAELEGRGWVEFLAEAQAAGLVLVHHPHGWLAISPARPQDFLADFAARKAEGALAEIMPESVRPAFAGWPLWRDRAALGLIAAGGLGALLLAGYLTLIFPQLPPQIALHFDAQGRPDRFGTPAGLFLLPAIAGLAWTLNTLIGAWLHGQERERAGAYLLFDATLFVLALAWAAAVSLLTAG